MGDCVVWVHPSTVHENWRSVRWPGGANHISKSIDTKATTTKKAKQMEEKTALHSKKQYKILETKMQITNTKNRINFQKTK